MKSLSFSSKSRNSKWLFKPPTTKSGPSNLLILLLFNPITTNSFYHSKQPLKPSSLKPTSSKNPPMPSLSKTKTSTPESFSLIPKLPLFKHSSIKPKPIY
jgi:hypothetical protein